MSFADYAYIAMVALIIMSCSYTLGLDRGKREAREDDPRL